MEKRQWPGAGMVRPLRKPIPLIEIADDRRVLIEHHQGVCSYSAEQIAIRVCYGLVSVSGSGLCIAKMTREQIVICGSIEGVTLSRAGGKYER